MIDCEDIISKAIGRLLNAVVVRVLKAPGWNCFPYSLWAQCVGSWRIQ